MRRSANGDWQKLPADEIFPSLRRSCASRKMQEAGASHRRLTAPQLWQMLLRTLPRHLRGPERMPTSLDVVWKGKAAIPARERREYLCAGGTKTVCKRASMDARLHTVLGVERRGVVGDSRTNVSDCEMVRTSGHQSFPNANGVGTEEGSQWQFGHVCQASHRGQEVLVSVMRDRPPFWKGKTKWFGGSVHVATCASSFSVVPITRTIHLLLPCLQCSPLRVLCFRVSDVYSSPTSSAVPVATWAIHNLPPLKHSGTVGVPGRPVRVMETKKEP